MTKKEYWDLVSYNVVCLLVAALCFWALINFVGAFEDMLWAGKR